MGGRGDPDGALAKLMSKCYLFFSYASFFNDPFTLHEKKHISYYIGLSLCLIVAADL